MVEKVLIFGESLLKHKKRDGTEYYMGSMTGYSRVTNAIAFRLADLGINIDIADIIISDGPIPVRTPFSDKSIISVHGINSGGDYSDFGVQRLPKLLKILKPGLLILIGDLKMYEYVVNIQDTPSTIAVLPIDGSPIPESWPSVISKFDELVSVSEFGRGELKKTGFNSILIPFGVDTRIYYPLGSKEIIDLKKHADLPENKWVWQFVGRNQPRKNLPDLFLTYRKFNEKYPDESVLYIHSNPKDEIGWNLFELARYYGIADNVRFTKEFFDTTQPMLNSIYNVADTHITLSRSEGFGLTSLESMATGTPQIVPNHTALSELVNPHCGELAKVERGVMGTALVHEYLPSIDDFVNKMIRVYENPGLREWYGRNALKKAWNYSWDDYIIPKWLKLIEGF